MSELREFVSGVLERRGAVVETCEPDGLNVLLPGPLQDAMRWREFECLDFRGAQAELSDPRRAIRIGLEGDWLEQFGALLDEHGRWAKRELALGDAPAAPGAPERMLGHALDLQNAVWRLQGQRATTARCLVLAIRYTAISDEKREGLVWVGFNRQTGAVLDSIVAKLLPGMRESEWPASDSSVHIDTESRQESALLATRLGPLLEYRVRQELDLFLRAMRRRFERDRARVHAYHDDLWAASQKRLALLANAPGEKAEADRKREQMRAAAVEREYRSKIDDLRHNYALRVKLTWVQALDLYLPVRRFDLLIRRRKGERRIALDWHPLVRMAEPPPCDWGIGLGTTRVVCDDKLHLTEPEGQSPCTECGKPFCRACDHACPRCESKKS
ncbi:MAG TPA: hypothetical protein VMF67_00115 [Rhizomicrobium sp.]|nr:hypothetical protein [Rhizomicrobium sp.]